MKFSANLFCGRYFMGTMKVIKGAKVVKWLSGLCLLFSLSLFIILSFCFWLKLWFCSGFVQCFCYWANVCFITVWFFNCSHKLAALAQDERFLLFLWQKQKKTPTNLRSFCHWHPSVENDEKKTATANKIEVTATMTMTTSKGARPQQNAASSVMHTNQFRVKFCSQRH